MTRACFISDLHLDDSTGSLNQAFITFLRKPPQGIDSLYIIGDLFEAWIGDDACDYSNPVITTLTRFCQDLDCYFIHGNRDFLIGEQFANNTGINLLPGQHVIQSNGKTVLIMHGDELCVDDTDYQQFRTMVRSEHWQQKFLAKPIAEREQIARQLREGSKNSSQQKNEYLMDANVNEIEQAMSDYNASILIHGHTHRPGRHQHNNGERIVLGDWGEKLWYAILENGKAELFSQPISSTSQ